MPREQLLGLAGDVGRLLAAGSSAVAGHDGLARRARELRQLGAKVPTLAAVAAAVERVTAAPPRQAGPAFLDLVVLTRQVRASLSAAGAEGALEAPPPSGPWQTAAAVPDVAPVHEALTRSGNSREEVLRESLGHNVLSDLRLVSALLAGLDDGYFPVAELVTDQALPALGKAVVPELMARVDVQGKKADARALRALCQIDKARGAPLCRRALDEGSVPLRAQALRLLPDVGKPGEAEQVGLELCRERNSEVRAAAVAALRDGKSDRALNTLLGLIQDKVYEVCHEAERALKVLPHAETTPRLVSELAGVLGALPAPRPRKKGGKPARQPAARRPTSPEAKERVEHAVRLVYVLGERKDDQRLAAARALLPLAGHHVQELRQEALRALGLVGPVTKEVLPALLEAAHDPDDDTQQAALLALGKVEPAQREKAVGQVLGLLERGKLKGRARQAAIDLLPPHMGRFGRRILAYLPTVLSGADWHTHFAVAEALIRIGPAARPCLPRMMEKIRRGGFYRYPEVLRTVDPDGAPTVPAVLPWLEDPAPQVRTYALQVLRGYGPRAARATEAVRQRLGDEHPVVRDTADSALNAILSGS